MNSKQSVYSKFLIYYFSGTGNAKNASQWALKVAEENGLKTEIFNIEKSEEIERPNVNEKTIIGIFTPTHGFNVPPLVLHFLFRFPKIKNADVFILNTRGGLKLHKLFLPGLSGIAQLLPALIFVLKGYKIVGMQPLDLPSNWLILHPGVRDKVVQSMYKRCNSIVERFTNRILAGKKRYRAFLSLPFDLAIFPVSILYYLFGRFFLAKTLMATDACNKCGKCIKQCPVQAIRWIKEIPFWLYKCESCMRCVNICPERAIETTHFYTGVLLFIFYGLLVPFLIKLINSIGIMDFINQTVITQQLWTVIKTVIFLFFLFGSYALMHVLMRFKLINRIIAYTSLSKYKFWRRYKAPKVSKSDNKFK